MAAVRQVDPNEVRAAASRAARRVDAEHQARAALVARADQQHALILAGDDRGVYGEYPPAAM